MCGIPLTIYAGDQVVIAQDYDNMELIGEYTIRSIEVILKKKEYVYIGPEKKNLHL